jgi:protein translocase subunit secF/protein translocase subunit secD
MNSSLKLKIGLVFLLLVFCALALLPSLNPGLPDWWKKYMAPAGLKLGLDLQGGMHIVLQVDLDKAAENSLDLSATDFKSALAEKNINAVRMDSGSPGTILFTLPNTGAIDTVKQILKDSFPNLETRVTAEEGSFPRITLQLSREEIDYIRKNAVNQSLEIIRNRIDQFGVSEPVVLRQGENQIVVQLPGVKDPDRAMSLIGQTAQLEFKLVSEASSVNLPQLIDETVKGVSGARARAAGNSTSPCRVACPGHRDLFRKVIDPQTKRESRVPLLLETQC